MLHSIIQAIRINIQGTNYAGFVYIAILFKTLIEYASV